MGPSAQDRAFRLGERTMGTAAARKWARVGRNGSLSRQRAPLSPHDRNRRTLRTSDESASDRALYFDFPGFCISIFWLAPEVASPTCQTIIRPRARRDSPIEEPH